MLAVLVEQPFPPSSIAAQLWEQYSGESSTTDGSISARQAGLLALIKTPEALEGYLLRAQSQDDAKRRGQRCIEAAQLALQLAAAQGWLQRRYSPRSACRR